MLQAGYGHVMLLWDSGEGSFHRHHVQGMRMNWRRVVMMALSKALQIHFLDLRNGHDLGTMFKGGHGDSTVIIGRVDSRWLLLLLLFRLRRAWIVGDLLALRRVECGGGVGRYGVVFLTTHCVAPTVDKLLCDGHQL